MRILITETSWIMATIAKLMRDEGFLVSEAADVEDVLTHVAQCQYDAVLFDPDLPDMDGSDLIRRLRSRAPQLPILLFSREVSHRDRLRGLAIGADDVIAWPFDGAEIAARVRAFARRARGFASSTPEFCGLRIDFDRRRVSFAGHSIHLTRLEYELVETLALANGRLLGREALITRLYGWEDEPDWKILDVYICRIRAKLATLDAPAQLIATSFGQGYRINLLADALAAA